MLASKGGTAFSLDYHSLLFLFHVPTSTTTSRETLLHTAYGVPAIAPSLTQFNEYQRFLQPVQSGDAGHMLGADRFVGMRISMSIDDISHGIVDEIRSSPPSVSSSHR